MAINTQLPFAAQPLQLQMPDPNQGMNALARAMAVKSAMGQNDLQALQLQEAQRGITDTNALNDAYKGALGADGAVDRNRLYSTLAERNLGSKIPDIQKKFLDTDTAAATLDKTKTDTQKTNLEMGIKKAEHAASLFSLAKDPQSYAVVRTMMKQQLGQDLPEQFDPNFVQAQVAMGQTITQKLADEHQKLTLAETQRHNTTTEGLTARGQNITLRGQNMVDARAKETNAQGKVPAGYRQKPDGSLEFIPGGPADPNAAKRAAPTEFQGKAAMFGTRAQEADRIISSLEGQYSPAGINTKQALGRTPLVGGALEAGANMALSNGSQKAEQAQRDFVNAVLRLESGAAISQGEFENARRQYFPQPGDSPAVIQQKAANRKTAIHGLLNNARPGAVEGAGGATGSFGAPSVDDLLKKYGGK